MRRISLACACVFALSGVFAAPPALGAVIELGATASPLIAPACPKGVTPANCTIILTQVTALETVRDGVSYPHTVKHAGAVVAFTIGLSALSTSRTTARSDIHFLDHTYGGTTQAAIAVLRHVGSRRLRRWKVVAASPIFHLQPYLGQVVQFPLPTALAVLPGDVVALTVPTWAPVLSIDLPPKKFAYRQSRTSGCNSPPVTSAAQFTGQTSTFGCDYPGTRVEYSATEVTNPVAVNPIH